MMTKPTLNRGSLAVVLLAGTLGSGCSTVQHRTYAAPALMPSLVSALEPSKATAPPPAASAAPAAASAPSTAASGPTRQSPATARAQPAEPGARPIAGPATVGTPIGQPEPVPALTGQAASERRFSVALTSTTPEVLFMALLNETPLSVAVEPSIKGPWSISLKDVTLREALELLRELHDLEYKVVGRHILVSKAQLQARLYNVDYPSFNRSGRSELRVVSGSITGGAGGSGGGSSAPAAPGGASGGGSSGSESSRVTTQVRNDLWAEVESSVKALVGEKEGRQVVVSPQSGTIVVRALPREQRAVFDYLEATRLNVQRQVMLEAKVVEVQLRDSERSGINWAAFRAGLSQAATAGVVAAGGSLSPVGQLVGGLLTATPGGTISNPATQTGSLLGLAFQTSDFAAVLEFLSSQGHTQVLSSPRIATLNNQKAVLKVGTDDLFVTNISTTTTAVGNSSATTPNISLQPFFSGISLDVTPNINAEGFITLHIHPAVSNVSERNKVLNLGTQGTFSLPLASSDINETDAVVRARDGQILAIGGLMRQAEAGGDSGVPGTEGTVWRRLFGGQTNRLSEKRELVILLKPTIIDPAGDNKLRGDALSRLLDWTESKTTETVRGTAR